MIDRNRRILRRNTWHMRLCWFAIAINAAGIFLEASDHSEWMLLLTAGVMAFLAVSMVQLADASRRLESQTAQLEHFMRTKGVGCEP